MRVRRNSDTRPLNHRFGSDSPSTETMPPSIFSGSMSELGADEPDRIGKATADLVAPDKMREGQQLAANRRLHNRGTFVRMGRAPPGRGPPTWWI